MENITLIEEKLYKKWFAVAPGVWGIHDVFVNMYLIHEPANNSWVLVDAGLQTSAHKIMQVAKHLFWPQATPSAIILTHGHFDHTGALPALLSEWDVPVYAHYLEAPYLTGRSAYPPPDPSAGGGMMTLLSWTFPKQGINLNGHLLMLPEDGSVPGLEGWRYIHTPGHTPGHISLYREYDGVLLAGDAFVTTQAESLSHVITQSKKVSGPPKYFTPDWISAESSVKKLAALQPQTVATGHGKPLTGQEMQRQLQSLADNFKASARPHSGRYVNEAAVAGVNGVEYIPPAGNTRWWLLAGAVALAAAGIWYTRKRTKARFNV
ncbi:MBL fold metallo-hydrolase [Chitinophaga sp. ARDCPP14]|uniref:MBL fold metallo-hydrolase n=1 Tax=Chitinophaga sp. ARDCPP14 TaxID=3391139 RepID=UPI003F51CEC3